MLLKKCSLEINLLKLLIKLGIISITLLIIIYYLTNENLFQSSPPSSSSLDSTITYRNIKVHSFLSNGYHQSFQNNKNNIIAEKLKRLTSNNLINDNQQIMINQITNNVHIFYSINLNWFNETEIKNSMQINSNMRQLNVLKSNKNEPNIVFYPLLGFYSFNMKILNHHFQNIRNLGIGVLIITWSPTISQAILHILLNEMNKYQLKLAIEIDLYQNRTIYTIFNNIEYFHKEFWNNDAFYKVYVNKKKRYMPMFYIRKISTLPSNEWSHLLTQNGKISLRRSMHNAVIIGHIT